MVIRVLILIFIAGIAQAQAVYPTEPSPEGLPEPKGVLVPLLDYMPGMGTLYKDPDAPLAGPFAAYDQSGRLVSTIYMVPIDDITAHEKFDSLKTHDSNVVSVDLYYNPGHHGFEGPHYHIVLWHIDPDAAVLN